MIAEKLNFLSMSVNKIFWLQVQKLGTTEMQKKSVLMCLQFADQLRGYVAFVGGLVVII